MTPYEEIAERMTESAALLAAIMQVLVDKGIVTEDEMMKKIAQMRAVIDQVQAERREEYLKTPEGQTCATLAKLMGLDGW